jgi:hypothetical protein
LLRDKPCLAGRTLLAAAMINQVLTKTATESLSGDVRKSSLDDTRKGPPDDVAGVKDGRHGDNFSFL